MENKDLKEEFLNRFCPNEGNVLRVSLGVHADWWLAKIALSRSQYAEEVRVKIEAIRTREKSARPADKDEEIDERAFCAALDEVLSALK